MIKLPIQLEVKRSDDWRNCLTAAAQQLDALQRDAEMLRAETARYIRPILLVQVERTGADMRDAGFIHAEDAKAHLLQLGFNERQIAIKTSDKNELKSPENIDLLSPICEVRAIVTKQALKEGWDCPFAYVLCALAAGRNLAAMTQLVGRILRQPDVAKTGRAALDACYVLCNDARTADVVRAIKSSLETEGMGDLGVVVRSDSAEPDTPKPVPLARRPKFKDLRIFVPRVCWVEQGGARRELVYESDVLAFVPWHEIDTRRLAVEWAPDRQAQAGEHLEIDLRILSDARAPEEQRIESAMNLRLDRARVVRALLDLMPNAWQAWQWVDAVLARLLAGGHREETLALCAASLIERLRIDIEAERDLLAQAVFERLLGEGQIEFKLRADARDYELPHDGLMYLTGKQLPLMRPDAIAVVEKSLLEPALRTPDINDLEATFAGYLDQKAAIRWWHRNVAKTQLGLQGWRRHKVYPDFVFGLLSVDGQSRTVLIETKGLYLSGTDTQYKQALLQRLTQAYRDERLVRAGDLELVDRAQHSVVCDLVFDQGWAGTMEARYFSDDSSIGARRAAPT